MPTLAPGAKTSLSHSLVVGTPGFPARMRIQLEFSCFSACNEWMVDKKKKTNHNVKWINNFESGVNVLEKEPGENSDHQSKERLYR